MRWVVGLLAAVLVACPVQEPRAQARRPLRLDTQAEKRDSFRTAYDLAKRGKLDTAAPLFSALRKAYPELEDYSLRYLAQAAARSGDGRQERFLWALLLHQHPQSVHAPRAALRLGIIHRRMGNDRKARDFLRRAYESGDESVRYIALTELAKLDREQGDLVSAHHRCMEVRRARPGTEIGTRCRRLVHEMRRRDRALRPSGKALENEARLFIDEGDSPGAIRLINHALRKGAAADRAALLLLRARAESRSGRSSQSLATLRSIADHYPDSPAAPLALHRYASSLWNRDRNAEARGSFLALLRRYPKHRLAAEALYALARIEEADGQESSAMAHYRRLAQKYGRSRLAATARWQIGWLRYKQRKWNAAAEVFARLAHGKTTEQAARAIYWRARSLEHQGRLRDARNLFSQLLYQAGNTYYAYWAERRLGRTESSARVPVTPPPAGMPRPPTAVTRRYHWIRARELYASGLQAPARNELRALEKANATSPALTRFLTGAYPLVAGYRDAIRVQRAMGAEDEQTRYPLAFWPLVEEQARRNRVPPFLVVALMRQESMFDPQARSTADARGLMQLLPRTARDEAHHIGMRLPPGGLYDPELNIIVGTAHLARLMQTYDGDPVKALAAYNGGKEAVEGWERRFGGVDEDEFVERITYRETRHYVKKVIANQRRYLHAYGR